MTELVAAAVYVREVPGLPPPEDQREALVEVAAKRGWQVVDHGDDPPRPHGPTRDRRPEFKRLLREVKDGRVAVVAAMSVDVVARSTKDLCQTLDALEAVGGRLYVDRETIDTGEPDGRARIDQACRAASAERRSRAASEGAERARTAGSRIGAARIPHDKEERVRQLRSEGIGIRRVATMVGVGVSAVQRVDAELRASAVRVE